MKIATRITALAIISALGISICAMKTYDPDVSAAGPADQIVATNGIVESQDEDVNVNDDSKNDLVVNKDNPNVGDNLPPVAHEPADQIQPPEPPIKPPAEPIVDSNRVDEKPANKNDHDHGEKKECDHFWRREYEPETDTENGYLIDSCLHCGEWYIYMVIAPYDAE
jgi:hypothetical protein